MNFHLLNPINSINHINDTKSSIINSNLLLLHNQIQPYKIQLYKVIAKSLYRYEKKSNISTVIVLNRINRVLHHAIQDGISGALSSIIQIITMMWIRTSINYQYRHGGSILQTIHTLYEQGGILRFYDGIAFALIQGPLSRFGSILANEGTKDLFKLYNNDSILLSTIIGSVLASLWRIFLMPIDTCKTVLQVEGIDGFNRLWLKVLTGDIQCLYTGTIATMMSTIIAHYPWFYTYNFLNRHLKISKDKHLYHVFLRNAFIGFSATIVSDMTSNWIRVIKTMKQSSKSMTYFQVITAIYEDDGLYAFFGRGLLLRIISNGIQSMFFTVLWKYISKKLKNKTQENKIS